MKERRKLFYLMLALSLMTGTLCHAQNSGFRTIRIDSAMMRLNSMTVEDYLALNIPSLDSLFFNAYELSSRMGSHDADIDYFERAAKTERRRPLEWVRILGSYNYGSSDMAAIALMETTYQVWTMNNSSQRNIYYNVGATFSMSLLDLIDMPNRNRQAKAKVQQSMIEKEREFEQLKHEIIEYYCNIQECISILEEKFKTVLLARSQYNVAETDFLNGKTSAEELYRSHGFESSAVAEYENIRKELNKNLLSLEVVTCTKIF
ncbi:MAG: TolC family protein [Bacteroidaceae bacterium]|nr:TolC family protein [Bacteroidaceae bacterium]